jgi:hypothetical protein
MALKYWYVAGNGSSNFSTAGVWYNGPGGTGGTTTTPTAADDAIVNAASGSGTLTITATATINSLNTNTFTGTLAGTNALNITTTTLPSDNYVLQLGGTHNYSGTITFTTTINGNVSSLLIDCNNIFHKGNMTFNSVIGGWVAANQYDYVPLRLTGILNLTAGRLDTFDIYTGTFSTSNSNQRTIYVQNLYLSGTGSLITQTTQTNLSWTVENVYITNTTATAKSLGVNGAAYIYNIYLQGSGASATTFTLGSGLYDFPNIFIEKTGGTLLFGTSYMKDLTFIEGTTITWAGSSTIVIYGDVTLCNSLNISTSSPLNFQGGAIGFYTQSLTTFGKTFTSGLTINEPSTSLEVYGNYISTATGTAISINASVSVKFFNSINLINGSIGISASGWFPNVFFYGGITSANALSIIEAYVYLNSTTLQGALTMNSSGELYLLDNSVHNLVTFSSSSTTNYRFIYLGNNTTINLRGTVTGTWNTSAGLAQGVLTLYAQTSTINIVDTTGGTPSFAGGGCEFYNLNINRSGTLSCQTTITGSNTFRNFKDLTINSNGQPHTILFAGNSTTTIRDTFQVGNSTNLTYIYSTSSAFYFIKDSTGLVICPNVFVQNSNASPANTWYAISGSSDGVYNSGWIFNTPPRRLGSLGAG